MTTFRILAAALLLPWLSANAPAAAAEAAGDLFAPSVWDLKLGAHAQELPVSQFARFACGTDGGPPSRPVAGWTDFASCRADAAGLHEIYFEYDDEPEYEARARRLPTEVALFEGTTVYSMPVIASGLFDPDGFLVGLRLVTDPRVDVLTRENASGLANFLLARFGESGWTCEDLPRGEGESEFMGSFVKNRCERTGNPPGVWLMVEWRQLRKAGQHAIDPVTNVPTEGLFESSTRFEERLTDPVADRAARLAALPAGGAGGATALIERARNCPGCDLRGANLKRADLTGADLSGADLTGANLHAAVLTRANLAGARLDGANLNRATLTSADLSGASLKEAMLYGARLDGANLERADLDDAMAATARLTSARLTGATAIEADLADTRFGNAQLAGANLSGALLQGAQFNRADLSGATLINAYFWRANLSDANLSGANLSRAEFTGGSIREADFSGADLTGADLSGALLSGLKLTGAVIEGTRFPPGYRPETE